MALRNCLSYGHPAGIVLIGGISMVITIGGKYGCGGRPISKKLAELLGYRLCDDEIITEAVKNSEFDMKEETFRYYDEGQGKASLAEIEKLSKIQEELSFDVIPLDRAMDEIQGTILNRLADEGNCILLGRCADYYLAGRKDVLSVLVTDDEEQGVRNIMEAYPDLNEKEAGKLVKKTNRRREDYYSFFTCKRWCDPENYAITINCSLLGGVDKTAEFLAGAIRALEKN